MSPTTNKRAHKRSNCFTCQARQRSEWCALADADVALLDRVKVHNIYEPGQVIFYQGNPCLGVYCVEEGTVALRKCDDDGNTMIVRLAHATQTLGYRSYFADEPYSATAEALSTTRVCFIDRAGISNLLGHNPTLGLSFLQRMARDLREAEEARMQTATLPVRARLAHLLLTLKDRFATVEDNGCMTIELPLSRQDLASIIGTRPETIARSIRALDEEGIARFDGRHVTVNDLDALLDELEAAV